jgi:hypothetical protein
MTTLRLHAIHDICDPLKCHYSILPCMSIDSYRRTDGKIPSEILIIQKGMTMPPAHTMI